MGRQILLKQASGLKISLKIMVLESLNEEKILVPFPL